MIFHSVAKRLKGWNITHHDLEYELDRAYTIQFISFTTVVNWMGVPKLQDIVACIHRENVLPIVVVTLQIL